MLDIGGVFALELARGRPLHGGAMALNSGRNALRVLLRSTGVKRIRIPVYGCPALVPAIRAEDVQISYYRVPPELEPDSLSPPEPDEAVLLINYFGLKEATVSRYAGCYRNVIVDQCQALFADPPPALGSIYSPRKFVGVADGGYLYGPAGLTAALEADESASRYLACLRRVAAGGPEAYPDYQRVEAQLRDSHQP